MSKISILTKASTKENATSIKGAKMTLKTQLTKCTEKFKEKKM